MDCSNICKYFSQILSPGYISSVSPNFPQMIASMKTISLSVFVFFLTFQTFILKNMASLEQMYLISMELRSFGQKLESPLGDTISWNLPLHLTWKFPSLVRVMIPKKFFCIENSRWKTEWWHWPRTVWIQSKVKSY